MTYSRVSVCLARHFDFAIGESDCHAGHSTPGSTRIIGYGARTATRISGPTVRSAMTDFRGHRIGAVHGRRLELCGRWWPSMEWCRRRDLECSCVARACTREVIRAPRRAAYFLRRDFGALREGTRTSPRSILLRISISSTRMGAAHFCRIAGMSRL